MDNYFDNKEYKKIDFTQTKIKRREVSKRKSFRIVK